MTGRVASMRIWKNQQILNVHILRMHKTYRVTTCTGLHAGGNKALL